MASSFRNLLGLPVKDWDTRADGQVLVMGADKEHWEFADESGGGGGTVTSVIFIAAGGTTDITATWQAELDSLEALGGGTIIMGSGTHTISMANADNSYACLRIPSGVTITGPATAIFTRPAAERTTNGVLLVNKYWDTNGGYTAAGDITLHGFTITDGASTGQRTVGDLIGLGHCDGALIDSVHSGNHDQHLVDICGSRNVVVRNCTDDNQATGSYTGSATVQIDWAHSLGISGLLLDDTTTTDVLIENCNFVNTHTDFAVQLGHNGGSFSRIRVVGNTIDGGYLSGSSVIGIDSDCSLSEFDVSSNTLIVNHKDARAANFYLAGASGAYADGLLVSRNKVRGTARSGFYFGINNAWSGSAYPNYRGLEISGNDIEISGDTSLSSSNIYGIWVLGFVGVVIGNQVKITASNDAKEIYGIVSDRNKSLIVSGNDVSIELTTPTGAEVTTCYMARCDVTSAIGSSRIVFANNVARLGSSSSRYGFNFVNGSTSWSHANDRVTISGNQFTGTPRNAHIYEQLAASDGTNGTHSVDFGSGSYIKSIASGNFYSGLPLGLKKANASGTDISPAKITLAYAPLSATTIPTDCEELTFCYLSSTTCAGTQIADLDQNAGTFSILTGNSGVSVVINNSTFQPVVRTSGYISAIASI